LSGQDRRCWFWHIPLSGNKVSVGLVADNDYLLQGRGSPEEVFAEEVGACPGMAKRLSEAELMGRLHVAREFSYSTTQHAGDGWVLVGDAFGFIDPVYSTGVLLALRSGELAADAIVEGLQHDDTSAAQLGKWTIPFKAGVERFRSLVHAFYTPSFSIGHFIKRHPDHRGRLTDLLIGRGFDSEMDPMLSDLARELQG
jgi:flavin-dependent dehydrogenase